MGVCANSCAEPGYTRIVSPTVVNEFNASIRRAFLNHLLAPPEDLAKIQRDKIGFTAGQFHPEINPQNIIPQATFTGISNPPTFGGYWGGRYPAHRIDTVYTLSNGLTLTRGGHTFKAGSSLFGVGRPDRSVDTAGAPRHAAS